MGSVIGKEQVIDLSQVASPGNPPANTARVYYDGTNFKAINSSGSSVIAGGGGGVSSLTGDGTLITNSGSTGAVTLTLGNLPGASMPTAFTGAGNGGCFCTYFGWGGIPSAGGSGTAITIGTSSIVWMTLVPYLITVRKISVNFTSSTANNAFVGLYTTDGNTRVINSGSIANGSASGVKTVTLGSPVTVNPGAYYVYIAGDNASVALDGGNTVTTWTALINANVTRRAAAANGPSGGNCPTTLGVLTPSSGANNIIASLFEA